MKLLPSTPAATALLTTEAVANVRAAATAGSGQDSSEPNSQLYGGCLFRAPHGGHRGSPARPARAMKKPPAPRRKSKSQPAETGEEGDLPEPEHAHDSYEARRIRDGFDMSAEDASRDSNSSGNSGEGARQERRYVVAGRWHAAGRLLPAVPTGPVSDLGEMVGRLHAIASGHAKAPPGQTIASAFAQAGRLGLATAAEAPATLASVREALTALACTGSASASQNEAALLGLPVFLLNMSRPRTAAQSAQAVAVQSLLEAGLAHRPRSSNPA